MTEYLSMIEAPFMAMTPITVARAELDEASELGHDVTALRRRLDAIDPEHDAAVESLHDEIPTAPVPGWTYFEGSSPEDIRSELPSVGAEAAPDLADLPDRVRGALYGRVAGNMLGKPVEPNWPRAELRAYLERTGDYPLTDYLPISDHDLRHLLDAGFVGERLMPYAEVSRGRIVGGIRDDDVDWTILNVVLLEEHGLDFTLYDVARNWHSRLPFYQLFTAERVAYLNLVREIPAAEAGAFRNGFREIIGALIRADPFAWVSPGRPRRAALLAQRDAYLSHRANGIYGEMWAAALIATAFTARSAAQSVEQSLAHVPERSRLARELRTVITDHESGMSWEDTMNGLDTRHAGMNGGHTINNAGALAAAILHGDGDFTATIAFAVQAGLDTDSIGATAGSWAGAFIGYDRIPPQWTTPLQGRTRSAVFGFDTVSLDALADRVLRLEETLR